MNEINTNITKVFIGSDHAGIEAKAAMKDLLQKNNIECIDIGPQKDDSVDYPDFAEEVCMHVLETSNSLGVLICGTGIGMSMAANKIKGIRAALVTNDFMAEMTRKHNNSNVLCFGARVSLLEEMEDMLSIWLENTFEGDRHQRRIDKIHQLEK